MEKFENYLKNDDIDEMKILLKNSHVDLLKTIAKRFKISVSATKKDKIIPLILKAVQDKKTFNNEPELHQMTVAQLKSKARDLNIDISSLKNKQQFRVAILKKLNILIK